MVEARYAVGEVNAAIFERYRGIVDARLGQLAPEILEQFSSVYKRLHEGDAEARSQALLSCRRILKALADLVYPARSQPIVDSGGTPHSLDDANYVNRIYQFVKEAAGGHKAADVLRAQIGDLTSRFQALNGLSSKGTHAAASTEELDQCAIQTYLCAGDLLQLYDKHAAESGPGIFAK